MGLTFYNWNSQKYLSFWLHCISFLHVYGLKSLNMYKKEIQNSQSDKYYTLVPSYRFKPFLCNFFFSFPCLLCVGKRRLRKKGVDDGESLMSLMSSLTKIPPLNPLRQSSFTLGNFQILLLSLWNKQLLYSIYIIETVHGKVSISSFFMRSAQPREARLGGMHSIFVLPHDLHI